MPDPEIRCTAAQGWPGVAEAVARACKVPGTHIVLERGTYIADLTIPIRSKIHINGDTGAVIIIKNPALTFGAFMFMQCTGSTICRLIITAVESTDSPFVTVNECDQINIDNLDLDGRKCVRGPLLHVYKSRNVKIHNIRCQNSRKVAIFIQESIVDAQGNKCWYNLSGNTEESDLPIGILFNNSGGQAVDNQCWGNSSGIEVLNDPPVSNQENTVLLMRNRCHNNTNGGIVFTASNGEAVDNECWGNEIGIVVQHDPDNPQHGSVKVARNRCHNNTKSGIVFNGSAGEAKENECWGNSEGIRVQHSSTHPIYYPKVTVTCNQFHHNSTKGISILGSEAVIDSNNIWGNLVGISAQPAKIGEILYTQYPSKVTVNHNQCFDNMKGISLAYSQGKVTYNECWNNSELGICIDAVPAVNKCRSDIALYGNLCHDNTIVGIAVLNFATGTMENNHCWNNTEQFRVEETSSITETENFMTMPTDEMNGQTQIQKISDSLFETIRNNGVTDSLAVPLADFIVSGGCPDCFDRFWSSPHPPPAPRTPPTPSAFGRDAQQTGVYAPRERDGWIIVEKTGDECKSLGNEIITARVPFGATDTNPRLILYVKPFKEPLTFLNESGNSNKRLLFHLTDRSASTLNKKDIAPRQVESRLIRKELEDRKYEHENIVYSEIEYQKYSHAAVGGLLDRFVLDQLGFLRIVAEDAVPPFPTGFKERAGWCARRGVDCLKRLWIRFKMLESWFIFALLATAALVWSFPHVFLNAIEILRPYWGLCLWFFIFLLPFVQACLWPRILWMVKPDIVDVVLDVVTFGISNLFPKWGHLIKEWINWIARRTWRRWIKKKYLPSDKKVSILVLYDVGFIADEDARDLRELLDLARGRCAFKLVLQIPCLSLVGAAIEKNAASGIATTIVVEPPPDTLPTILSKPLVSSFQRALSGVVQLLGVKNGLEAAASLFNRTYQPHDLLTALTVASQPTLPVGVSIQNTGAITEQLRTDQVADPRMRHILLVNEDWSRQCFRYGQLQKADNIEISRKIFTDRRIFNPDSAPALIAVEAGPNKLCIGRSGYRTELAGAIRDIFISAPQEYRRGESFLEEYTLHLIAAGEWHYLKLLWDQDARLSPENKAGKPDADGMQILALELEAAVMLLRERAELLPRVPADAQQLPELNELWNQSVNRILDLAVNTQNPTARCACVRAGILLLSLMETCGTSDFGLNLDPVKQMMEELRKWVETLDPPKTATDVARSWGISGGDAKLDAAPATALKHIAVFEYARVVHDLYRHDDHDALTELENRLTDDWQGMPDELRGWIRAEIGKSAERCFRRMADITDADGLRHLLETHYLLRPHLFTACLSVLIIRQTGIAPTSALSNTAKAATAADLGRMLAQMRDAVWGGHPTDALRLPNFLLLAAPCEPKCDLLAALRTGFDSIIEGLRCYQAHRTNADAFFRPGVQVLRGIHFSASTDSAENKLKEILIVNPARTQSAGRPAS